MLSAIWFALPGASKSLFLHQSNMLSWSHKRHPLCTAQFTVSYSCFFFSKAELSKTNGTAVTQSSHSTDEFIKTLSVLCDQRIEWRATGVISPSRIVWVFRKTVRSSGLKWDFFNICFCHEFLSHERFVRLNCSLRKSLHKYLHLFKNVQTATHCCRICSFLVGFWSDHWSNWFT